MTPKYPNIITVEGADGTGKTSFVKQLVTNLKLKGLRAAYFPIIEGNAIGEKYKKSYVEGLLDPAREVTGMLFSCMHTLTLIQREMSSYFSYVIVDRSFASFNVYQILTNQYTWAKELYVSQIANNPEYTSFTNVYLTTDIDVAFERMKARGSLDAIESRGPEYQAKIVKNYDKTFNMFPALAPHFKMNTTTTTTEQAVDMFIQNYLKPKQN